MSIQYNVWDKLKDLNSCSLFQISNLAQFLTYLFIGKGLPISILKVHIFEVLNKLSIRIKTNKSTLKSGHRFTTIILYDAYFSGCRVCGVV